MPSIYGDGQIRFSPFVSKYKMPPLDQRVDIQTMIRRRWCPGRITIYLAAAILREARTHVVNLVWDDFKEKAEELAGQCISDNEFAALVGHGPHTIKRALGRTAIAPPKKQNVLADIERFVRVMMEEEMASLAARLHCVRKRTNGSNTSDSPRSRMTFTKLGKEFIDAYVDTYRSLSGDKHGRIRLYQEILEQALTRRETLNSENWSIKIIQKRLQNTLAAQNRTEEVGDDEE